MSSTKLLKTITDQQRLFADNYIKLLNIYESAINAGYSDSYAKSIAHKLLDNISIQEYIKEKLEKKFERLDISAERILKEYARIAFCSIRQFHNTWTDLLSIEDISDDDLAAIAEVEHRTVNGNKQIKIKLYNKQQALDSLAKYKGLFEKDNSQKKPIINMYMPNNNRDTVSENLNTIKALQESKQKEIVN